MMTEKPTLSLSFSPTLKNEDSSTRGDLLQQIDKFFDGTLPIKEEDFPAGVIQNGEAGSYAWYVSQNVLYMLTLEEAEKAGFLNNPAGRYLTMRDPREKPEVKEALNQLFS